MINFYYVEIAVAALLASNLLYLLVKMERFQVVTNCLLYAIIGYMLLGLAYQGYNTKNIFSVTPLSLFFASIITLGILLVNLIAYGKDTDYQSFGFFSAVVLIGGYLVAFSANIVEIFIGLEMMLIITVLATLFGKKESIEAPVKLFLMAATSMGLLVFGSALFYGNNASILLNSAAPSLLALLSLGLIIAAISFEASLFPFNLWVPDVYEGSPSYVTALIGGVNKNIGFFAIIQILIFAFAVYKIEISTIFVFLSILTMFYGNLIALRQDNVKRLFAYSSISQAGYIAIGIAAYSQYGIQGSLIQIFAHTIAFIAGFACIISLERHGRTKINDYIGLYKENKLLGGSLAIVLLSLVGIPFTIGFIGKFTLFSSAIGSGLLMLALFAILNTVISIFYYSKLVLAIFADKANYTPMFVSYSTIACLAICLTLILLFGIFPEYLFRITELASSSLGI